LRSSTPPADKRAAIRATAVLRNFGIANSTQLAASPRRRKQTAEP
jgi:hypothetical protein